MFVVGSCKSLDAVVVAQVAGEVVEQLVVTAGLAAEACADSVPVGFVDPGRSSCVALIAAAVSVLAALADAWVVPVANFVVVHLVRFEIPAGEKPVLPLNSAVVPPFVCAVEITGSLVLVAPAVVGLELSAAQPEPPHHLVALIGLPVLRLT